MEVMLDDMEQELGSRVALPATGRGIATESYKQQIAEITGLHVKDRSMSVDSTHFGSDNEHEEGCADGNEPQSTPPFATSPPPPHTMSNLNLDNVAQMWSRAQEMDKGVGQVASVREGLQAEC